MVRVVELVQDRLEGFRVEVTGDQNVRPLTATRLVFLPVPRVLLAAAAKQEVAQPTAPHRARSVSMGWCCMRAVLGRARSSRPRHRAVLVSPLTASALSSLPRYLTLNAVMSRFSWKLNMEHMTMMAMAQSIFDSGSRGLKSPYPTVVKVVTEK